MSAVALRAAGFGGGLAAAAVYLVPHLELGLFVRSTAELAGLLSGAPTLAVSGGWLLPFQNRPLLVSEACSGAGFFILLSCLLTWHLGQIWKRTLAALLVGLPLALVLAPGINALRVLSLGQAHHWLIPQLPEAYSQAAHLAVGVGVFLPALIALNLVFEIYGNRTRNQFPESPASN